MQKCNYCGGRGWVEILETVDCGLPDGSGPTVSHLLDCPVCNGWGYIDDDSPMDGDNHQFPELREAQIETAYEIRELELRAAYGPAW